MNNRDEGKIWESKAENYLVNNGYKIICRNWTGRWSEIDIIAQKNNRLIFFEVKYRSSDKFGLAEEAITNKKRYSLKKSVYAYLSSNKMYLSNWDFDVICFNSGGEKNMRHYRSVTL